MVCERERRLKERPKFRASSRISSALPLATSAPSYNNAQTCIGSGKYSHLRRFNSKEMPMPC
jgi:hypothetical protein